MSQALSDAVDLPALRRLDPGAVDGVFDTWSPRLNGFLRRFGASQEVAEELVQETFLRLLLHAAKLSDDTRVGAWLFTVARNLYLSHRRWSWVDGTRLLELAWAPPRHNPNPAELFAAGEGGRRLEEAVRLLPRPQQEVFLLVGEGFEPSEVAAMLGITAEAVRQRLARARKALGEQLTGTLFGEKLSP